MLSIPLLIGCLIGEANAGWLTDWMVLRYAKKHDGVRVPEARLNALWFGLLVPIGVIIEGVCITHFETVPWIGAAFGMGIANCGLQAATTVTYAYTTDVRASHKSTLIKANRFVVLQASERRDLVSAERLQICVFHDHIVLRVSSRSL